MDSDRDTEISDESVKRERDFADSLINVQTPSDRQSISLIVSRVSKYFFGKWGLECAVIWQEWQARLPGDQLHDPRQRRVWLAGAEWSGKDHPDQHHDVQAESEHGPDEDFRIR